MTTPSNGHAAKSERTLFVSMLMSAPGPLLTGMAAAASLSATQIADFIRRTAELVALVVSWWVFRKLQRSPAAGDVYRVRLERAANRSVAGAMTLSGIAMLVIGVSRLFTYEAGGDVTMGLIIAILGAVANTIFWLRYRRFAREKFDPVIASQQTLYRAKAFVDLCVVSALVAVAVAPTHPATRYVDALGSIIVAGYLLYNGLDVARSSAAAKDR